MKTYNIYKHPKLEIVEAVKIGFSWPALFFNFFWMLIKRLWLCAGLYFIAGIALSQLDKLAEKANSDFLDYFLIIAYLAMLLVPGFMGNKWRNSRFKKQSYALIACIKSESIKGAIAQVTEKYVEVYETINISEMMVVKSILESANVAYKVSGESLNSMGLLSAPAKVFVPTEENEKASQLLRQVGDSPELA